MINFTAAESTSDELYGINEKTMLLCTWVVYGVTCQIINVFGVVTNIVNSICFTKQGFSDPVNISLLGLSVSDLGSLTAMIGTCIFMTPAVTAADLPFDPVEVSYLTASTLHWSFTRVSSWITAMITLERCLCITAPLQVKRIITPTRVTVIIVCMFIFLLLTSAPVYAVNSLGMKFSAIRNKTLVGLVSTGNRETVEKVTFVVNSFLIPFFSFVIIVVCTIILSLKLKSTAQWRQTTITSSQTDRVSNRNQKVSKMVVMISILFIVCFVPMGVTLLAYGFLSTMAFHGAYINILTLTAGFGYIMEGINSSTNILIYYHMSSKYRETFLKIYMRKKNK